MHEERWPGLSLATPGRLIHGTRITVRCRSLARGLNAQDRGCCTGKHRQGPECLGRSRRVTGAVPREGPGASNGCGNYRQAKTKPRGRSTGRHRARDASGGFLGRPLGPLKRQSNPKTSSAIKSRVGRGYNVSLVSMHGAQSPHRALEAPTVQQPIGTRR